MAVLPVKFPEGWTQPKPGEILRPRYDLLGNDWFVWSAHNPAVGQTPYLIETRGTVGSLLTYGQRGLFASGFTRAVSAGVNQGVRADWVMASASDGLTIAAVAKPSASTSRKTALSQRYGSSPFHEHRLGFNTDEASGASSGAITLFSRNQAAGEAGVKALNAVDGNWHAFVAGNSSAASSGYIYRDGQALSLTTNTSLTGTYDGGGLDPSLMIGNLGQFTGSGDYVMDEPMVLVIGWRRQLNASLAALISKMLIEDPYSVFEEYRPLFFFPAAGDVSLALTGQAVTVSPGTLTSSVTQALSGQSATVSAGTVANAVSQALSGQASTVSAGDVSETVSYALTGQAVTAAQGNVTANVGGDVSLALSGQAVTVEAGTLVSAVSQAIAGQSATLSTGTVTQTVTQAISGQAITAAQGTVTAQVTGDVTVALTGLSITVSQGTVSAVGGAAANVGGWPIPPRRKRKKEDQGLPAVETAEEQPEPVADTALAIAMRKAAVKARQAGETEIARAIERARTVKRVGELEALIQQAEEDEELMFLLALA